MSELKHRLKLASTYKDANFYESQSIGVIGRGPSVYRLDLCYKKFNHCYLTGEFNNTLDKIGKYITGKDIVLCIMQLGRYRTSKKNCVKFNIKNIQVHYQNATPHHKTCIKNFSDLKVIGFSKRHYEIVSMINNYNPEGCKSIFSTGMLGIVSALYFNPKDIYIIGLDFYNRSVKPYFVKEDMDISDDDRIEKSIKGLRDGMLESIYSICELFPEINLHIYTTYDGIKSKGNLNVIYV